MCYSLTSVYFPECILISNYAFAYCRSRLTSVYFPECTSIGSSVFTFCYRLTIVSFPKCTFINSTAFCSCSSLNLVYFLTSTVPTLSDINAFYYTPISTSILTGSFGSIFVLPSMVDSFKTATNWATYSARIVAYTG